MPPLETETAVETYERGRFENRVSPQELSGLCNMIRRLMTDRLRNREPRVGAPAAAAALACQPVAPQPIAQPNEPENVAQPEEEPERRSSSSSSSIPPRPEKQPRGGPGRSRRFNLRIIGIPEAEDKANEAQAIVEQLMAENFPELQNGASLQIEKAHRVPSRFNEKKATPRHILVTFVHLSDKERVVRLSRQRKEVTFQGVGVRLASDFSPQVLQARRQWSSIYRVLQENEFQPRILYPARLSFVCQGKRKTFLDAQALRKFIAQVPSLENLLSDLLLPVENESSKE